MKFKFLLIYVLINFCTSSIIKSEEKNTNFNKDLNIKENLPLKEELNKNKIHLVKEGETLSSIARSYSINLNSIIETNNLDDENYIYAGQKLLIPANITINKNISEIDQTRSHTVQKGETLTDISLKYGIKLQKLIKINKLEDPDSVKIGRKILLDEIEIKGNPLVFENKTDQKLLKKYGPLLISSKKIELKNSREVLDAINTNGENIKISLNCNKNEIDVKAKGDKWKGWLPAKKEFEKELLKDFCSELIN